MTRPNLFTGRCVGGPMDGQTLGHWSRHYHLEGGYYLFDYWTTSADLMEWRWHEASI